MPTLAGICMSMYHWFIYPLVLFALISTAPAIAQTAAGPSRVSVLLYHRFSETVPGSTTVKTSVFAEQLTWLAAHRVAVVPLHTLVDGMVRGELPGDGPVVALTADDGHPSVYSDMYPLIRQYRVPVTLFIYPQAIANSDDALTWAQLAEMIGSGLIDVQSHTYSHPNFWIAKRRLGPAAYEAFVKRELAFSKSRLETRLGIRVDLLAWPYGICDAALERHAAEAGYIAAFGVDPRPLLVGENRYALPRYTITNADRGAKLGVLVFGATAEVGGCAATCSGGDARGVESAAPLHDQ
jgi:peptidoglycan/xylan/chitin deacetylase (PgdA/CDA1 family)